MLMLSRNIGKAVIIGGNIRITVAQVNGCQVRLGIDAPRGVIIDREEIHQRRVAEGTAQQASEFNIDDHVKLVADARRYRHLRDRVCIEDPGSDVLVFQGDTAIGGGDLDRAIDTALRLDGMQQQVVEEQEP